MVYKDNKELPATIKALPSAAQSLFREVANSAIARGNSDEVSFQIAWTAVKRRFKKSGEEWVAKTEDFEDVVFYEFSTEPSEEFISRTDDGHIVHNYVLTDIHPDKLGTAPSEEMLKEWADDLAKAQPEVDTDHSLWERAKQEFGGDVELVGKTMRGKRGIARITNAVVTAGKLVVSVLFDKRFERHIDKIKGMSVEAAIRKDRDSGRWTAGKLFGATFAINKNPVNPRAVAIS